VRHAVPGTRFDPSATLAARSRSAASYRQPAPFRPCPVPTPRLACACQAARVPVFRQTVAKFGRVALRRSAIERTAARERGRAAVPSWPANDRSPASCLHLLHHLEWVIYLDTMSCLGVFSFSARMTQIYPPSVRRWSSRSSSPWTGQENGSELFRDCVRGRVVPEASYARHSVQRSGLSCNALTLPTALTSNRKKRRAVNAARSGKASGTASAPDYRSTQPNPPR
jgi:hypothetical protein